MKKKELLLIMLLCPLWVIAGNSGFGESRYSLTALAEYSYNTTWGHHGNMDLQTLLPFNRHFEMEARLQMSSANVFSGALQFRPKFAVPVGEFFLETDVYYRALVRNRLSDMTAALCVGYRMDYVSLTLGVYGRVLDNWDRSWYTNETYTVEPFNLLYRLEVFTRPQDNNWNLSFLISNVDDYQMERQWQPLFGVGAWYDVTKHWRINFMAQCKPTGMFHLNARFYGATFKTGFTYRF